MNLLDLRRRGVSALALAVTAVLALAGAVQADSETGQHGNYLFRDDSGHAGAVCVYAGSNPFRLVQIIVRAPYLWWPDTNAESNTQHGKVGFRGIVRLSKPGAYGPWDKIKQSDIHKATAYEDQPDYDVNDKAPLTKITMSFDPSKYSGHPNAYISVRIKGYWYKKNGDVLGTVTHDVFYYEFRNVPEADGGTTACPIRMEFN